MFKIVVLCVAVFAVCVQAELSPLAKQCIQQVNINEDLVKSYIGGSEIPEDNDLAQQFFACVFGDNINDAFEVAVNDKLKGLARKILSDRTGGKVTDETVAINLLNECINLKGSNKGSTAIKITNCYNQKVSAVQV